jgi:hypothetical protein
MFHMRLCLLTVLSVLALVSGANHCLGQEEWPKAIALDSGAEMDIFKPEISRFDRTAVQFKSVFSIVGNDPEHRLFGMAWVTARVVVDSAHGRLKMKAYTVDLVRIPDDPDSGTISTIWALLKGGLQDVIKELPLDEANAAERARYGGEAIGGGVVKGDGREKRIAGGDSGKGGGDDGKGGGDAGKGGGNGRSGGGGDSRELLVYFRPRPALLVKMTGWPFILYNDRLRVDEVANSSIPIVKAEDGKFYLYSDWRWYRADSAPGTYTYVSQISRQASFWQKNIELRARSAAVLSHKHEQVFGVETNITDRANGFRPGPIRDVVITMSPAMLIESDGDPQWKKPGAAALSYLTNSDSDIFVDSLTHSYYMLVGEQWYRSPSMFQPSLWEMVASLDLPESFLQIPALSEKGRLRQYVAGTDEAEGRVMDRQIPIVVRTERYRTAMVTYDGQPFFRRIKGTNLKYSDNTCAIVLYDGLDYYTLFAGVWFVATSPKGFWTVSDHRPEEVGRIPARYAVSRAKFVDVFGVSAESVWDGYLPEYLEGPYDNCNCRLYCSVGFPGLGPAEVANLLARAKAGRVHWGRPKGLHSTGLFSKQYY